MLKRPRRNRKTASIRALVRETDITLGNIVAPYFVVDGENQREPIESLPGHSRLSPDLLLEEAEILHANGIGALAFFPVIDPSLKDNEGSEALNPNGLVPRTIALLKKHIPDLCIITDIALDPYTSHGHDGVARGDEIVNDESLQILGKQALIAARAGVDMVAPSDMMDGRVEHIRKTLDSAGFTNTSILSYTAKYASHLYGPFRGALKTSLTFGDKKTYQMDPANSTEAIREALLDQEEGADMLIVKPALAYLDIIAKLKEHTNLPICAYHVSGEYAMVMAAHEKGWLDATKTFEELLLCIRRAGASFIFSYAFKQLLAKQLPQYLYTSRFKNHV